MGEELVIAGVAAMFGLLAVLIRWPISRLNRRVEIHDAAIDQIRSDCAHHMAESAALRETLNILRDDVKYIRQQVDSLRGIL